MRRKKLIRFLERISDGLPRKHPVKSKNKLPQPFFIIGSGRNGSTLLNRMLNQHPDLFLPSEQYFLGNSIAKFKLYNWLLWRDLVKVVIGELMRDTGSHTWDFEPNEVFRAINESDDKSLQKMTDTIFRTYGEKSKDFSHWGDTTPLNTCYLPEIWSVYPQAKYVFLIRDGRDVVDSYKRGKAEYLGELSVPEKAVNHWKHAILQYDWLQQKTKVHMLRYEELVTRPEEVLLALCEFLEVDYVSDLLHFHQHDPASELYKEPQHANIFKPVNTESVGKWRESFKENDPIFSVIQKELKRFGYL